MRRSFGLAITFVVTFSALLAFLFPVAATATPSDTTIYPITCVSSGRVNVFLDYGINAITITNPNACHSAESLYISDGTGATWTYSQTIGGTTTSGSYDPAARPNFETGAIGSADSFTLTLASNSTSSLTFSNGYRTLDIFFNNQFNTLSPNPVAIGQQVTVTGSNLSSVSSLSFMGSSYFSVTTANRTATQLTFTVPLTYYDFMSQETQTVIAGNYTLSSARGKTITFTVAPVVVSVNTEELARQAALVATAKREEAKKFARESIANKLKSDEKITLETFVQAEVNGITPENLEAVQTEIYALPASLSGDITGILKIARKYEIVNLIASDRLDCVYSSQLIEIGLISEDSKNKAALTAAVKKLPIDSRSSYNAIQEVMGQKKAIIQARHDRYVRIVGLIVSRQNG
jgi:hypothetical protein